MSHCSSEERRNWDFLCLFGRGWCNGDTEGRKVVLFCFVLQQYHRKSLVGRLSCAINDKQNGCQLLLGVGTHQELYYPQK